MNNRNEEFGWAKKYFTLLTQSVIQELILAFSHKKATTQIKNNDNIARWNLIVPHLYLGKIPTVGMADEIKFLHEKLGLVVSCVWPFELNGNAGTHKLPIETPEGLNKRGIDHHLMIVRDFTADVDVEDLYHTVKKMREYILAGKDVYVHCKAGKGRSAMVVATYLAIYETGPGGQCDGFSLDAIHAFMKSQRNQVKLGQAQLAKVSQTVVHHRLHKDDQDDFDFKKAKELGEKVNMDDIQKFLTSTSGKAAIAQFSALKHMHFYADDKRENSLFTMFKSFMDFTTKRNTYIQQFLDSIYEAKNDLTWLYNLFTLSGPILQLMGAKPGIPGIHSGVPVERNEIVEGFQKEVLNLLVKTFNCPFEVMKKLVTDGVLEFPIHRQSCSS